MWKTVWFIMIAVLYWVPLVVRAELLAVSDFITEADSLFSHGEDMARDRQALDVIARALARHTDEYQLLWRAARVYYHVGDDADAGQKQDYFARGIAAGQRAVALQPGGVEGHFW